MARPKWLCRKCGNPIYTFRAETVVFWEFKQPNQAGKPFYYKDSSKEEKEILAGYICYECKEPSANLGTIAEWRIEED